MAELKRSFGFWTVSALLITAMVGTGMFFGTSLGAALSGNAVLVAWLIVILASLYVAGCFGELVALFPKAGGVYEFSKHAYGRFMSFMVGWLAWLMSNIGTIILIIAALNLTLPADFSSQSFFGVDYLTLIAIALLIILNFITYLGVDISAFVLMLFAALTIAVFLAIIFPGFMKINLNNLTPFFSSSGIFIFGSTFFMLEALMGWEEASFLSEETKDPTRTIPKALIVSTLIAGILALLTAFISLGVIPWQELAASSTPFNDVINVIFNPGTSSVVAFGIFLAFIGSAAGAIISTPRLLLAMARDKLFISQFASIHPKRKTPHKAIVFQTIVSIIFVLVAAGAYDMLIRIFTPLALLTYISVLIAVPVLRIKYSQTERPFKVIFGKIGPFIIAALYLCVLFFWMVTEQGAFQLSLALLSLIFFGIPIYLILIFLYNPPAIISFLNSFSYLSLWLENLLLPRNIKNKILGTFSGYKGKNILEFGCGVGSLTIPLSKIVGEKGKVYSVDVSEKNISILDKRIKKKSLGNVKIIHDIHFLSRVHPSIKKADVVFSVGYMSYLQEPVRILRSINTLLPENGQVCFVEYTNFFKFLPDAEWLSNKIAIESVFRQAGFSVRVERVKGLLWNYLFVYGIKSKRGVPYL
jgi:APA family basic amino acid/polyamine antiporter